MRGMRLNKQYVLSCPLCDDPSDKIERLLAFVQLIVAQVSLRMSAMSARALTFIFEKRNTISLLTSVRTPYSTTFAIRLTGSTATST